VVEAVVSEVVFEELVLDIAVDNVEFWVALHVPGRNVMVDRAKVPSCRVSCSFGKRRGTKLTWQVRSGDPGQCP
jgi:hypothetical protein